MGSDWWQEWRKWERGGRSGGGGVANFSVSWTSAIKEKPLLLSWWVLFHCNCTVSVNGNFKLSKENLRLALQVKKTLGSKVTLHVPHPRPIQLRARFCNSLPKKSLLAEIGSYACGSI